MPLILGTNSIKTTGYEVANSLRTNKASQPRGEVTQGTPTNVDKYTFSVWVKRADLGAGNSKIFSVSSGSTYGEEKLEFNNDDLIWRHTQASDGNTVWQRVTDKKFRDPSAWYHIVVAYDSSQGTASDRCKMYINGVQETSFSGSSNPSSGLNSYTNTSGRAFKFFTYYENSNTTQDATAYFAEMVYIDGQQLDQNSFGEFDSDSPNIWKPIDVSGLTFGNNGFYLDFEDSSDLGADVSGNNNDMTLTNISVTNQSTDTCTNNFATWNVLSAYNSTTAGTLSEGNLKVSGSASDGGIPSTIGFSQGKWYWEIKYTDEAGGDPVLGIINSAGQSKMQNANSGSVTSGSGVWCIFNLTSGNPGIQENGAYASSNISGAFSDGDIGMFAVDPDAQKIWYGKNGTWYNSGNPATGANATSTNLTANETWFAYVEKRNSSSISEANFGSPPYSISSGNSDANGHGNFEYAVPSGYFSLCSKNLSEFG